MEQTDTMKAIVCAAPIVFLLTAWYLVRFFEYLLNRYRDRKNPPRVSRNVQH